MTLIRRRKHPIEELEDVEEEEELIYERPVRSVKDAILKIYNRLIESTDYVERVQLLGDFYALTLPYVRPETRKKVEDALREVRFPLIEVRQRHTTNWEETMYVKINRPRGTRSNVPVNLYDVYRQHLDADVHMNIFWALYPHIGDVIKDLEPQGLFPREDEGLMLDHDVLGDYPS